MSVLPGEILSELPPGTHRALVVNVLGFTLNKDTPVSFLIQARNLNCDLEMAGGACPYPYDMYYNPLSYFGKTQDAVVSTQTHVQPHPRSSVYVKMTSLSSVKLSWEANSESVLPGSEPLEVLAKTRISGDSMAGWTCKSVVVTRSNPVEAAARSITIPDLEEGRLYDFVVFVRNRHIDAWPGWLVQKYKY